MAPLYLFLHTYSLRFHFQYAPGYNVFAFIERAVADGFTGVSISANGPGYRHLGGTTSQWFASVRDRIQADRLLCDIDTSGTSPEHLKILLDVAEAVGAQQLRTYTRHRGTPQEMVDLTTRDLLAVAPLAERVGIRVMLENHEKFTGPEIAQVLERVNNPWIAALYDYGNSMMVMEDPLTALGAMAPYAHSAHLKDHVMLSPQNSPDGRLSVLGVPIGQGNLPIVEITRRLIAAGLDRIVFENVWAYRAPIDESRKSCNNSPLGAGAFAFAHPPFDAAICLLDPGERAAHDPQSLVSLEDRAMKTGLTWLRRRLAETEIILANSWRNIR